MTWGIILPGGSDIMDVLKIELDGITTSFRYPHFLVGRQMSYPMPPPATIYGHICSAAGDYIDPSSLKFAYYFTYEGKGDDLETIYSTSFGSGRVDKKWGEVKNVELNMNPILRELFLFPKLTLYIDTPELEKLYKSFLSPRYPVILGRSQDLASYREVKIVNLEKRNSAYLEGTLLPNSFTGRIGIGISVIMPKFIDPNDRRNITWWMYMALDKRVFIIDTDDKIVNIIKPEENESFWIDPDTEEVKGLHRGIIWHSFSEEEEIANI